MGWIWTEKNGESVNVYGEFLQSFLWRGGKAELRLSAADEWAVFVNGAFAACGQYDDYPERKVFDTLDLSAFCGQGENQLRIRVYCQGENSAQCIGDSPKLWYRLETEGETLESGAGTLCRSLAAYAMGPCEKISPQLAFAFRYDARLEETGLWKPAEVLDWAPELVPRPIKALTVREPAASVIKSQGRFLRDRYQPGETPADRIWSDLLAPRYPVSC